MTLDDSLKLWKIFDTQTILVEAIELYNAIINAPLGDVLEVGSASGGTTIVLMGAAEEVGKMVYSVDTYPDEFDGKALHYKPGLTKKFKANFKRNILDGKLKNIVQFNEDISYCINKLPKKLSVIFIDSCHELSFVEKEIELLVPLLVPKGYLYIHDVDWTVGQVSNTQETALFHINEWIKKIGVTDVKPIGHMLSCRVL